LPIDEQGHLAADLAADGGQFPGLLVAVGRGLGKTPGVKPGQAFDLAGLEALDVALGLLGDGELLG
jgi:hypothetical protein